MPVASAQRGDHPGRVDQRLVVHGHHGPGGAQRHHRVAEPDARARRPRPWSRRSRRRSAAPPGVVPGGVGRAEHLGQHAPGGRAPARRDRAGRRRWPPTSSRCRRRRRGRWSGAAGRPSSCHTSQSCGCSTTAIALRGVRLGLAPASAAWSPAARPAAPRPPPRAHACAPAERVDQIGRRDLRPLVVADQRRAHGVALRVQRHAARAAARTRRWPARLRAARRRRPRRARAARPADRRRMGGRRPRRRDAAHTPAGARHPCPCRRRRCE